MIISVFTRDIKLTCIYKFVMLQDQLKNLGAHLNIFVVREFYEFLQEVINKFENFPEYSSYCSLIKGLEIIPCDHNDHLTYEMMSNDPIAKSGILDSDIVLLDVDRRLMISIPPIKELISKTICCKFRSCNDLRYHQFLALGNPIYY